MTKKIFNVCLAILLLSGCASKEEEKPEETYSGPLVQEEEMIDELAVLSYSDPIFSQSVSHPLDDLLARHHVVDVLEHLVIRRHLKNYDVLQESSNCSWFIKARLNEFKRRIKILTKYTDVPRECIKSVEDGISLVRQDSYRSKHVIDFVYNAQISIIDTNNLTILPRGGNALTL